MTNPYIFSNDEAEYQIGEQIFTEVEYCGSVSFNGNYIEVHAPVASLKTWRDQFPQGWVGVEKVIQITTGNWWKVNIRKDLYLHVKPAS